MLCFRKLPNILLTVSVLIDQIQICLGSWSGISLNQP